MNTLEIGQQHEMLHAIEERDIDAFAALSGDRSLVHMDAAFARAHGFSGRVVHGALLAALVSRMVGTEFPGDRAVLERMDLAFRQPCYAPCEVVVRASVRQVSEAVSSAILDISITEKGGRVLVTGKTWHRILNG